MATLHVEQDRIRLVLRRWERLGAVHGDLDIPATSLVRARPVAEVWTELRGIRAPGTGFPGQIMLGTTRSHGQKDFCAVYRHGPGLVVDLRNNEFARVLVSLPANTAARLSQEIVDLAAAAPGSTSS